MRQRGKSIVKKRQPGSRELTWEMMRAWLEATGMVRKEGTEVELAGHLVEMRVREEWKMVLRFLPSAVH